MRADPDQRARDHDQPPTGDHHATRTPAPADVQARDVQATDVEAAHVQATDVEATDVQTADVHDASADHADSLMSWKTALLAALSLFTALLLQRSALPLLALPGAAPIPMVVLLAAFALVRGPFVGSLIGFCGGLVADLAPPTTHGAGREAFLYCLIGYLCGKAAGEVDRTTLAPLAVVAVASAFAVVGNAALSLIFGAVHPTLSSLVTIVPAVVLYDVLLAPFIVPAIAVLVRRLDPEPRR